MNLNEGPREYESNYYFRLFHQEAAKLRREHPGDFPDDFSAQAETARRHPALYSAAWGRSWHEIFCSAVQWEESQGHPLDEGYRLVAQRCPEGAKSITSVNLVRRY